MIGEQAIFNLEIKKNNGLSINPDIHHFKVFSSVSLICILGLYGQIFFNNSFFTQRTDRIKNETNFIHYFCVKTNAELFLLYRNLQLNGKIVESKFSKLGIQIFQE